MTEQVTALNFSTVVQYNEHLDAILFYPPDITHAPEAISIYITIFRDLTNQDLVGIMFTEFRMLVLSLQMNGALQTGSPLPIQDVLCVAQNLSRSSACSNSLFQELKSLIAKTTLSAEEVLKIPQYALA